MGSLILTKKGMELRLKWLTFQTTPSGPRSIRLFKNNLTIGVHNVLSDLVYPTFGGYTHQTLGSYSGQVDDGTEIYSSVAPILWACTTPPSSAETIYGYGIVQNGTDLIWICKFTTPTVISLAGHAMSVKHYDRDIDSGGTGIGGPFEGTIDMITQQDAASTGGFVSDTAFVAGLFTNTPTLSRTSVLADLVEPAWTGYTRQSCPPFLTPFDAGLTLPDGAFDSIAPYLVFQPSSGWSGTETVIGYFLVGNNSGLLKGGNWFPGGPQTLHTDADFVYLVPKLRMTSFLLS